MPNRGNAWVQAADQLGLPLLTGISHTAARLLIYMSFLMPEPSLEKVAGKKWLDALCLVAYFVPIRAHTTHEVFASLMLVDGTLKYTPALLTRMVSESNVENVITRAF